MPDQPRSAEDVKALVAEQDIRFIRLWFTDILGQLKSFSIGAQELDDAFEGGMGFDGSSITGFNAIEESDMVAVPDPDDVRHDPVAARGAGRRADVLRHPDPGAHAVRGRPAARPAPGAGAHAAMGFDTFNVGPELEYFLFKDNKGTEVLDEGGYFDLTTLDAGSDVRRRRSWPSSSRASTWSTPTTRSARPSTRSTCATPTR
jgi:glutamine synthetase